MRADSRQAEMAQRAGGGHEVAGGVFGVEADFDGVAGDGEIGLQQGQAFAGGDAELPFDQILAGDHLGDRVFDLEAGVHFHEVEAVALHDEFDGACADIADRAGGGDGGFAHGGARGLGQAGGWGFLDDLLVAALDRAVALEEADGVAVRVGEDLDFDVARAAEIAFDQHAVVAEGGQRFAFGGEDGGEQVGGVFDDAHALAASAGRSFDEDGVADAAWRRRRAWLRPGRSP